MLESIITWVTDTVFAMGYPGIALLMAIESSAIPFPSEVVMPPAGYLVAQGRMSFAWVMVAGVAGSMSIPPTIAGSSCRRSLKRVTTPKLPPPPRIAQKRSG